MEYIKKYPKIRIKSLAKITIEQSDFQRYPPQELKNNNTKGD